MGTWLSETRKPKAPSPRADKPAAKRKTPAPPAPAAAESIEKFVIVKAKRSQLKEAEYNPRTMSTEARKRLGKGLDKHGMVQPIVWNVRSGNVVGGHQRLAKMDKHYGWPRVDYDLTVSQIDVDKTAEVEINLLLNNAAAMGDFDMEKLETLFKTPDFDPVGAGWDPSDAYRLFGDVATAAEDGEKAKESVRKALDQILEVERATEDAKKAAFDRDREDFYIVVVFSSYAERKAFTDARGLEDNRYQSAESFGPAPSDT